MKRYFFLTQEDIYEALNRLRDAFLAAKDGSEVQEIINAILTTDEKIRIGRRIIIAQLLASGLTIDEIVKMLKVGTNTVMSVAGSLHLNGHGFELLEERKKKVEKDYQKRKYRSVGGSTKVFKSKEYTGFKRKNVKR